MASSSASGEAPGDLRRQIAENAPQRPDRPKTSTSESRFQTVCKSFATQYRRRNFKRLERAKFCR
jgi:hypothetical protein